MRRKDREVTDPNQITEIMSRCQVLHVAINRDGAPYVLPVNFGMEPDGMTLYIHGAKEGTKYELLARDNRVGFEMDCTYGLDMNETERSCSMHYESVMGWGIAEELTGEDEKRHAAQRIMAHYHQESFIYDDSPLSRTRILRIHIQERTGKRRVLNRQ